MNHPTDMVVAENVQADLEVIQQIKVNPSKKLGVDLKKILDGLLEKAVMRRSIFVEEQKRRINEKVKAEMRQKDGVDKLMAEFNKALAVAKEKAKLVHDKGYYINFEDENFNYRPHSVEIPDQLTPKGDERKKERLAYIENATKAIEAELVSVDKIRAKLYLCETYGDAHAILKAVFGNHDGIL